MNIGVFLPNWIGDAVMATPALRALRTRYPSTRLVGVGRPAVAELLAGTPWLDETLLYDPRHEDPALRGLATLGALRAEKFRAIVLLTNSLRTGLLAYFSGADERIGFAREGRGWLLTHKRTEPRVDGKRLPRSALDAYLELVATVGCRTDDRRVELATSAEDERQADAAWSRLALPRDDRVVVFNAGGAFGPAKMWPTGYFATLARRLVVERDRSVLVLCGPAERDAAREIVRGAAHPRVTSLADQPLSLGLSKACVRRAGLMVTTDSGPRHFAAAFGVPVVTLFGPTHIAWSENYWHRAEHVQLEMDCVPCQQRSCPLGHHRCMTDLAVDRVYRAVCEQLSPVERIQAA